MSLADDLERLAQLHSSGALSEFEFESAKRKLLASGTTESSIGKDTLSEIQHQNEVAQLDRQWQINRDKFLVHGRYGSRIPSKGSSVAQGLVGGIFGSIWTIMALGMAGGVSSVMPGGAGFIVLLFPAFGVFFTLMAVFGAMRGYAKAEEYEVAEKEYQREREKLLKRGEP